MVEKTFNDSSLSILLGEENKIGSELNLGSYDEYTHFFARDIVDQNAPLKV